MKKRMDFTACNDGLLSLVFSGLIEFRFGQQSFPADVTIITGDSMPVIAGDAILRLGLLFSGAKYGIDVWLFFLWLWKISKTKVRRQK